MTGTRLQLIARRKHRTIRRPQLFRALQLERFESRLLFAADFGDAPVPYPTLIAENGASHINTGPMLGHLRDAEVEGVHSVLANADDATNLSDDEDGVSFGTI